MSSRNWADEVGEDLGKGVIGFHLHIFIAAAAAKISGAIPGIVRGFPGNEKKKKKKKKKKLDEIPPLKNLSIFFNFPSIFLLLLL